MTDDGREAPPLVATASQTVGPFFHFGLTADGAHNAGEPHPAAPRLQLRLAVTDGQDEAVSDAMVEIWVPGDDPADPCAFARLPTAQDGSCTFETALPAVSVSGNASHVNVCVFARGLLRHLHTRIYFSGDPALSSDAVMALVPDERRRTLLAVPDGTAANHWRFDLRLQGADETVFFDV